MSITNLFDEDRYLMLKKYLKNVRAGIKIYGVLSFSEVNELLSTYEINEIDINTLENLTQQASLYYDEFSIDSTRKCFIVDFKNILWKKIHKTK